MDLIVPRPEGLYCAPGDFHIDPVAARGARDHHPWPRRSRALRQRSLCLPGRQRPYPAATARRRHMSRPALWRDDRPRRRDRVAPSGRPCARLRANPASNIAARSGSPRATTSSRPTASARRSSRCAATSSSPNRPSACRSTAGARKPRFSTRSTPGGATTRPRAARASSTPMRSARRSACSPASGGRHRPDRLSRRDRADQRDLPRGRRRACRRRFSSRDELDKAAFASALIVAPPSAAGSAWLQPLRRLFRRARERLDAGARQPPPARPRPRLRAFRPRRLAGPSARDRGDRRRAAFFATHGSRRRRSRAIFRSSGLDARALATDYGEDDGDDPALARRAARRRAGAA